MQSTVKMLEERMRKDVSTLNHHHARILEEIFEHPFPRNLEWPDVVSLVRHLGSVLERHDGKYEFQIGDVHAVFSKPHHKDVEAAGIAELRRFLTQAGVEAESPPAHVQPLVLLVDHHSARFFEAAPDGSHLEEREHLEPKDPHGFEHHLEHRKEADYEGQRAPEASEFYERVAQRLKGAPSIVLIGDATAKSSAMTYLAEYLKDKHKEVADHIVATKREDLSRITVGEIERIARSSI
jgi:hypothetical protein